MLLIVAVLEFFGISMSLDDVMRAGVGLSFQLFTVVLGLFFTVIVGGRFLPDWLGLRRDWWGRTFWAVCSPLLFFAAVPMLALGYFYRDFALLLEPFGNEALGFLIAFVLLPGYVFIFLLLPGLGLLSLPFFIAEVLKNAWKKHQKSLERFQKRWAFGLILLYIIMASVVTRLLMIDFLDDSQASRFFTLNAAIKNTCLLDARQENCPHSLEEISYIEPAEFARANRTTQLWYGYEPDKNEYVFVVRYSRHRAVVFSNKLMTDPSQYDFREVKVEEHQRGWLGKNSAQIVDPPPFGGPWSDLPLWNK